MQRRTAWVNRLMEYITQSLVFVFVVSTMFSVGLLLSVREIVSALDDKRWLTRAFPAAALFIALAALGGWLLGGPHPGPRRMLSLNCGQPNLAAAMIIASQNFNDPRVVLMLLVILLASLPIVVSLSLLYARQGQGSTVI